MTSPITKITAPQPAIQVNNSGSLLYEHRYVDRPLGRQTLMDQFLNVPVSQNPQFFVGAVYVTLFLLLTTCARARNAI